MNFYEISWKQEQIRCGNGLENGIFWSEIGFALKRPDGTTLLRFARRSWSRRKTGVGGAAVTGCGVVYFSTAVNRLRVC